jgi:hypothetical protein
VWRAQALAWLMASGTIAGQDGVCAWATCALISFSCSFIASVLTLGMMIAAPTARAWQITPNR